MRVVLFGLGKNYEIVKQNIVADNIIALSDNNEAFWGETVDGKIVIPPQKIIEFAYDILIVTCKCWKEVMDQLVQMGIDRDRIYNVLEYPMVIGDGRKILFTSSNENQYIGNALYFAYEMVENGGSIAMLGMIEALKNNGCQVDVICYKDGSIRGKLQKRGIRVLLIPEVWRNKHLLQTIVEHYSFIIINSVQQYRIVDMLSNCEIKILWWIHEPPYFYKYYLRNDSIEKIHNSNCTILFVSNICQRTFESFISNHYLSSQILSPGIEDEFNEKSDINSKKAVTFAVVGHICEEKGQELLLDAMDLLDQTIIEFVKILLIGEIPDDDYGKRIIARTDMMHNVSLMGKVKNDDVHQLYSDNQIDVVVCPSRIETFSLATVEGMMHEKTVIVSSNTGVAEYITNGVDGYVFEEGNATELAKIISYIVENKNLLLDVGKAARQNYDNRLSISALQQNLKTVINKEGLCWDKKKECAEKFSSIVEELTVCADEYDKQVVNHF